MGDALQMLASFLETTPYCDNTHYEGQTDALYVLRSADGL